MIRKGGAGRNLVARLRFGDCASRDGQGWVEVVGLLGPLELDRGENVNRMV